jgi:GTPase SAR1 family protein
MSDIIQRNTLLTNNIYYDSPDITTINKKLDFFLETKKIPHIIFHGASGTGKRTVLQRFLHKIYDEDRYKLKTNVMTVNCAHSKGIKFIREDLKNFAKTNVQAGKGILFKSIVLLNADHLTIDAQSALRRCIELFSNNTRFFIIVENKNRLFNPILSRFCEIYIPEIMLPDGTFDNLHSHRISNIFPCYKNTFFNLIKKSIMNIENESQNDPDKVSVILVDLATDLYERGVSALDIISTIQHMPEINESRKSIAILCFHKVKSEFRNEKMLIFYIIDRLVARSSRTLRNVASI